MNLQTKIPLLPEKYNLIDYNSKVLLLGSCFSENIGDKFSYFKFQYFRNPFGILFHPLAIENLVTRSINKDYYHLNDLHFSNEQWCSFDAHSKLNRVTKEDLQTVLNAQIDVTHQQIKEATHIIFTLGTAWVYRHIASDTIVANCHKLPQKAFLKELLPVETIVNALEATMTLIKSVNSKVVFQFTVSPVRHLKDGFAENTLSKAHLIAAIHKVLEPRNLIHYFPAYEIMMDELRDYRFYDEDMIHPSKLAIDFIWNKFKAIWISEEALDTAELVSSIQTRKAHRAFNPNSDAHQQFLEKLRLDIEVLHHKHNHISF